LGQLHHVDNKKQIEFWTNNCRKWYQGQILPHVNVMLSRNHRLGAAGSCYTAVIVYPSLDRRLGILGGEPRRPQQSPVLGDELVGGGSRPARGIAAACVDLLPW